MTQCPHILLAEDDDDDAFLFMLAARKADITLPIDRVSDGEKAIEHLKPLVAKGDVKEIGLVVVDLKMPRMDGFQVLNWIRSQPPLSALNVIVCSSSDLADDREKAKELGAKGYLVKPAGYGGYDKLMLELKTKWVGKA